MPLSAFLFMAGNHGTIIRMKITKKKGKLTSMQNQQVRRLTEGALMAAVFTVMLVISVYVPIFSLLTALFLAVPAAWYSAKYGWRASLVFALVSLALSALFGSIMALPLALIHLPFGLAIGLSLYYKKSKLYLFLSAGLALLASLLLQYVAAIAFFGINVIEEMTVQLEESYAQAGVWAERMGSDMEAYNATVSQMLFTLETMLPTLFVMAGFIIAWGVLSVQLPLLKRLGVASPKFPSFRELRLPKSILWYFLIIMLITLLFEPQQGTMLYMALMNLTLLLNMLFFLQGISFYHFYIHQEGWPKWVTVLVTVLAVPLQSFTTIVGIIDLAFNIRGWLKRAHEFKGK